MASTENRPGLLSKVALFVKNPTKDWSELDQIGKTVESGYDKDALKAMIERKRQNDFVRKREFDQLRKLRSRDASGVGGLARPSIFQTSIPTDMDGRADTLKKIDEIEAQMSKQWWKGKQEAAAEASPSAQSTQEVEEDSVAVVPEPPVRKPVAAAVSLQFESTQSEQIDVRSTGMGEALTQPSSDIEALEQYQARTQATTLDPVVARPAASAPLLAVLRDRYDGPDVAFSTSKLFALEVEDMATDPELEEAAIRFANGDDVGAELSLLEALRSQAIEPESARAWLAALLDLYRATNNRSRFDKALAEFSLQLDGQRPEWFCIPENAPASPVQPEEAAPVVDVAQAFTADADDMLWNSPAVLDALAMEDLRDALSSCEPPWHLGWSRLSQITADAMPLVGGLFASLCDEPVALRFTGAAQLVGVLREMMPSGDRSVDADWWLVRLNALRAMHLHDEFELAALDYCVTYEISPPAWTQAQCVFEDVGGAAAAFVPPDAALTRWDPSMEPAAVTVPMAFEPQWTPALHLRGDILGDATAALGGDEVDAPKMSPLVVSCEHLVRVDFSAAGSILNWVAMRQAEGCEVQFRDVHRLVAAFFTVIGIHEHARVVPRAI